MTRKYNKLPDNKTIHELYCKYIKYCEKIDRTPTKNGLTLALDISRKTYCEWKKKSNTLKRIDQEIEEYWVERLTKNNVAGVIFYLKNAFGYRDRQETDITSGGKPIPLFDNTKK